MKSIFAQWLIPRVSEWLLHEPPLVPSFLCDFEKIRFEIRPADVLLIEGRNRVSRTIQQITQSNWSHAVLYIGRLYDIDDLEMRAQIKKYYKGPPDEQLVIESLMGKGTIVIPLSRYNGYHVRICRPRSLSREDAQKVVEYSVGRLGMRYSLRHVLDLARFLMPWGILPRQWRSSLFVHNALKPTEEICSSLIASAFQSIHFPIIPEIIRDRERITLVSRNPRLYTPKDFDYSPFFDIIKYPMLYPIGAPAYHNLRWETDAKGGEYLHIPLNQHETKNNNDGPLDQEKINEILKDIE